MDALVRSFDWIQPLALLFFVVALAVPERRWPRRVGALDAGKRWRTNLGLYALGLVLLWLVMEPVRLAAIRLVSLGAWHGLAALPLPDVAKVLLGVAVADLVHFGLHWLSHHIPLLWRLHQVHHADAQFDVSTSVRHHPLEVLALGALSIMLCAALGVPLLSLLIYALLLVPVSVFCHANVALPPRADAVLRGFVVTPDMHRVHHAARMDEGNANFGMVFPWWDRVFRTYRAQPQHGHEAMVLGLMAPARSGQGLWASLLLPFARP